MFDHLDAVLRSLLAPALPDGTQLSFDAPQAAWAQAGGARVNAFLHHVGEDGKARAGFVEHRDASGRVIDRGRPPRRYRAGYSVTAWAADSAAEHALLGAVLTAFATHDTVPSQHLPEALAAPGQAVAVAVADAGLPRLTAETWSALGVPPRSTLDVVLTATLPLPEPAQLAAPPSKVKLGVERTTRRTTGAARKLIEPPKHEVREA